MLLLRRRYFYVLQLPISGRYICGTTFIHWSNQSPRLRKWKEPNCVPCRYSAPGLHSTNTTFLSSHSNMFINYYNTWFMYLYTKHSFSSLTSMNAIMKFFFQTPVYIGSTTLFSNITLDSTLTWQLYIETASSYSSGRTRAMKILIIGISRGHTIRPPNPLKY